MREGGISDGGWPSECLFWKQNCLVTTQFSSSYFTLGNEALFPVKICLILRMTKFAHHLEPYFLWVPKSLWIVNYGL